MITKYDIIKNMEEKIKYWKEQKDEHKVDYLECLLEIYKNGIINNHKHVYANLESMGEIHGEPYAEVRITICHNIKRRDE